MMEVLQEALKNLAEQSPLVLLFALAIYYLYQDAKRMREELRQELKEVYQLRISDMKDLYEKQSDINEELEEFKDKLDNGD